ncbi:MAG: S-layer homology domain-containing protein [Candidatus Cohnella colombiensis]|uniref:S-layer homology domain-containing protein n=1 Tax=Candidatus Cohnella colombiensis TaxID=3121368 RepID=A0AA95EZH8_9BACL|nr:MAG: S-layer homology domain-containing protein [Cohnella sp.]
MIMLITSVFSSMSVSAAEPWKSANSDKIVPDFSINIGGKTYPNKNNNYITAHSGKLWDGNKELRFIGYNSPNYAFIEDPDWHMASEYEMEDMIKSVAQSNSKVIRVYSLGFEILSSYNGNKAYTENGASITEAPKHIGWNPDAPKRETVNPAPLTYTQGDFYMYEPVWEKVDYFLATADRYGVKVIFPFVNEWDWFGGKGNFANYYKIAAADFYRTSTANGKFMAEIYDQLVSMVFNRTNTITGIKYKEDPAIMAWETGNELRTTDQQWIKDRAKYMHVDEDMNQLFQEGNEYQGSNDAGGLAGFTNLAKDPYIDLMNDHYYLSGTSPDFVGAMLPFLKVAKQNDKPFIVGEFGASSVEQIDRILKATIDYGASGALIWSLRYRNVNGGYYWHREGESASLQKNFYSYHWPGFAENDHYDENAVVDMLYKYAYAIDGEVAPPMPIPDTAPLLFDIKSPTEINWRGTTGANAYDVERATNPAGPWTVIATDLSDSMSVDNSGPLFADVTTDPGVDYYYRIRGSNVKNPTGYSPYSNVVGPVNGDAALAFGEDIVKNLNPGFEANATSIAPWTWQAGTGANEGTAVVTTEDKYEGTNSVKLSNGGELMLPFKVLPQASYTVSFWMKTNNTGTKFTVLSRPINAGVDNGFGDIDPWTNKGPTLLNNYTTTRWMLGGIDKELSGSLDGRTAIADGQWHQYSMVISGGNLDIKKGITDAYLTIQNLNGAANVTYIDNVTVHRNMVSNGGFANRGVRWNTEAPWSIQAKNNAAGGGDLVGYIAATGSGAKLSEKIYVRPNTDYVVSFHVKSTAPGVKFNVEGHNGNAITALQNLKLSDTWDRVAYKFNSGQNNTVNIVFTDTATGGITSVDDIDLVTAVNYKGELTATASSGFTWIPNGGWTLSDGTAQLVSTSDNSTLVGEQSVLPNMNYKLSFSGKSASNGVAIKVEDSTTGLIYENAQFNSSGNNQFANYVVPFTTLASATGIRVTLIGAGDAGTHTFMAFNLLKDSGSIGNADFEAPTLAPWTLTADTVQIVADKTTANARTGDGSLKFVGTAATDKDVAEQTISVSPDSTYSISFWMKASAANTATPKVNVFGQDGSTPLITTFSPANAGISYATSSFIVNTGSNSEIKLQFVNNTTNARSVFLDDLAIVQLDYNAVPTEPQSVLENGEYYAGAYNLLKQAWSSSNAQIYLDSTRFLDGKYSLRIDYDNTQGVPSIEKTFAPKNLSSSEGIQLWLASEVADGTLQLTLKNSANQTQVMNFPIKGSSGMQYTRFADDFDSSSVTSMNLKVIGSSSNQGTLYVDAVKSGSPYLIENGKGTNGWAIVPAISGKQASAAITPAIDTTFAGYGANTSSLKITYAYNTGSAGTAKDYRTFSQINKPIDRVDWSQRDALQFWIKPEDATPTKLTALIYFTNGKYAEASYTLNSSDEQLVTLPFSDFTVYPDGQTFNQHGLLVNAVGLRFSDASGMAGSTTNKVVHLDQFRAVSTSLLNLKATPGDLTIQFNYDEPDFLGYSGIDIDVSKDGNIVRTVSVIPGAGVTNITGLDNETEYTFTFKALSGTTIVSTTTIQSILGNTATVTVAPEKLYTGASLTGTLSVTSLIDKSFAQKFEINYDPSIMSYVGTSSLHESVEVVQQSNDSDLGIVSVTLAVEEGITGIVDLLNVQFISKAELSEPIFDSSIDVRAWLSYDENNPLDAANFKRISGIGGKVSILIDNTALKALHDAALDQYNQATPGSISGTYPIAAMDAFAAAIGTAALIVDEETSTRADIEAAIVALQMAKDTFVASVIPYSGYVPPVTDGTTTGSVTVGSEGNANISVNSKLDSEGHAKSTVDSATLTEAFEKALPNKKGKRTVVINIPQVSGARAYEQTFPSGFVNGADTSKAIEVNSEIAAVTLPSNLLNNATGAENVTLTVSTGDKSKLSSTVQAQVGGRPMIVIGLTADGQSIAKTSTGSTFTVSVPYSPSANELTKSEYISVWSIDESGNAIAVPSGKYDPATGTVTFKTNQFGTFVIMNNQKTFDDIQTVNWAKKEIEVLASKGIINGTSETKFNPSANITRADFLLLLVKTLGLQADFNSNFSDVNTNDYYYEALGIAKALGISTGTKDGLFDPKAQITRQDAMVLVARALRLTGDLGSSGNATDLNGMKDKDKVSSYAVNDVAALVDAGLVQGSGDKLNPLSNTSRAEIAVMMYRVYNR